MDFNLAIESSVKVLVEREVKAQLGDIIPRLCQAISTNNANLNTEFGKILDALGGAKQARLAKAVEKLGMKPPKPSKALSERDYPFRDAVLDGSVAHCVLTYMEKQADKRGVREDLVPAGKMSNKSFHSTMAGLVRRGFVRRVFPGVFERTAKAYKLRPMSASAWKRGQKPPSGKQPKVS